MENSIVKRLFYYMIKYMSPVYFDDQNEFHMKTQDVLGHRQPSMVRFILKTGIIKSEQVAVIILLIVAALFVFATYHTITKDHRSAGMVTDKNGDTITIEIYIERLESGYYNE